ncbi:MAG: hypothetical protein GEU96_00875 [Propionibacteriales bacterium]|nr:hypothetical protein [Propionibacteriales bacterium]
MGELVEFWTVLDEDRVLLEGRRGATALGFAPLTRIEYLRSLWEAISGDADKAVPMASLPFAMATT